jgi:hypothetical protein
MKKILSILFVGLLAVQVSFGQFYDGFTGTGTIGGSCSDSPPTCNENGWFSHSNTANNSGTMSIVAGNLSYTGLAAPTGGKVSIPGNATTPRDINADISSAVTGDVGYFSAIVNIPSQATKAWEYFIHFSQSPGGSNATGSFFARTGVQITATGLVFGLYATSGGTATMATEVPFGTHLIVVKFDKSVQPNVCYMWVDPTSLGGTEPAYTITNNTTGATPTYISTYGGICIRNSANTPVGYEIDEIRAGSTWASVTPASSGINNASAVKFEMYPNPATTVLNVKAENLSKIVVSNTIGQQVVRVNTPRNEEQIDIAALQSGVYFVTVTDMDGNSSVKKVIKK